MKIFNADKSFVTIILAIIFGLIGGLAGGIIVRQYLVEFDYPSYYASSPLNISEINKNNSQNTKKIAFEQDAKIVDLIDSSRSSFVAIYRKINEQPAKDIKTGFNLSRYYNFKQPLGIGMVLTSDGWIITGFQFDKIAEYVAITKDKKIYDIILDVPDSQSKMVFARINANDLSVKNFAAWDNIKNGQLVVAVNWQGQSWLGSIDDKNYGSTLIKSSDDFSNKIRLINQPPKDFYSSALLNFNGDIVGLINQSGDIEPITHFYSPLRSLLKNNFVKRPFFGVNYINYEDLVNSDSNLGREKGVVLYQDEKTSAIVADSPAEKAGLQAGDVIYAVDNEEIGQANDLVDIIQKHVLGDRVIIQYRRNATKYEIEIVLDAK